jgi:hypothetical protein
MTATTTNATEANRTMRQPCVQLASVAICFSLVLAISGCASNDGAEPIVTDGAMLSTDPNCNTTGAKNGYACTQDCILWGQPKGQGCGLNGLGTKVCMCRSGIFWECPCFRPPNWGGAPTAPLCPTVNARGTLSGQLCTKEWDECITSDPVTGTTPYGCACLKDLANPNRFMWFCGSTSSWFSLDIP